MSKKPKNLSSDLQGLSQLSINAVKGTTKVVESLHSTISQFTSILGDPKDKTSGITRAVYKSINAVTQLLGDGIDAVLNKASQLQGDYSDEHKLYRTREAVASAMNGVLGDHFDEAKNPLAIKMSFRLNGKTLSKKQLNSVFKNSSQITILIHGLCMNDLQWTREEHNHGESLEKDCNQTIIYLHYNTGLSISQNGKLLSKLLSEINNTNNTSINILAHSMGGLVTRSACYYAEKRNQGWLSNLNKIIFLGTPHHGAILAKGGHWADVLLQISPYSAPFAKITKVRSKGLTDLRHGNIIDKHDQIEGTRKIIPLPENVECYAIATITSQKKSKVANDIVGDGLVTLKSALGESKDKNLNLNFANDHQWTGQNINHMQLLSDEKVYEVIKKWITG